MSSGIFIFLKLNVIERERDEERERERIVMNFKMFEYFWLECREVEERVEFVLCFMARTEP